MAQSFDTDYIIASIPSLIDGLGMTALVSALSISFAIIIGIVGAGLRVFRIPVVDQILQTYVEFIRNTPLLVQIFFIFYGLPPLGIRLSPFWSGVLALTLWGGAFNIENFRGGFIAVARGLREAAEALGFNKFLYLRLVALPLGMRVAIPSVLNTSVSVLKNSAYLQAIGLAELTFVAMDRLSSDFRTLEMFASIGLIYLVLVLCLSWLSRRLEARLQRPFRTA